MTILDAAHPDLDLKANRAIEGELAQRHADWKLQLVPPLLPLPEVRFDSGSHTLSDEAVARLETAAWALTRWEAQGCRRHGLRKQQRRHKANAGGAARRPLPARGFIVRSTARFPAASQRAQERALGLAAFRKVELGPLVGTAG